MQSEPQFRHRGRLEEAVGARQRRKHITKNRVRTTRTASVQQKMDHAELISEMRHLTEGQKSLKMLTRVSSCAQVARDHEVSGSTCVEEL